MSLEQEIKLIVNSEDKLDLSAITWPDGVKVGAIKTISLLSAYYDTPELDLSKGRLGLRLRRSNQQWMQTVKTSGRVVDGFHQRDEWEHPLESDQWDLDKLYETPVRELIDNPTVWDSISTIFTTDFIRQAVLLSMEDGSQIELAYDYGKVFTSDAHSRIHEVELELISGDVEHLKLVATYLEKKLPISLSNISKAQMGYELLNN